MFLDDKIVEMVMQSKPEDYDSQRALLDKIIKLCNDRVSDNLHKDMNDRNIVPATKQVCNVWNSAARTLEKKGYPFLAIDGYKNYLLSKPDLSKTLTKFGFK